MKTATRPQYHRLQRILELIREGTRAGSLPNCRHFTRELEVSRRTLMRDLDFLRDDHHAPIAYDDSRKGFRLTDPTFTLPPVQLTRREVFSFSIARKLLQRFDGTPLELDMRSVLAKIADSLRGTPRNAPFGRRSAGSVPAPQRQIQAQGHWKGGSSVFQR